MNLYKIITIFILIFILIGIIYRFGLFNINQIEVKKNNVQCFDDQKFLSEFNTSKLSLSEIKNENILFFNEQRIKNKIFSEYVCVKNISFEKKFPNKLKIIINGRKSIAKISSYKSNELIDLKELEATVSSEAALLDWSSSETSSTDNFIIDDEGIIFTNKDENGLPVLYMPIADNLLKIGNKLKNTDFKKVSLLFNKLSQMNVNLLQTKLSGQNLQVLGQPKIVFLLEKDVLKQLASLQLILEKAKIDERNMEIIDLRFDKPVVKYLPKK